MTTKLDIDTIERVYTLICQKERILKRELLAAIDGLNEILLVDILFYLKVRRGIFMKQSKGIFKDYATYEKMVKRQ